MSSIILEGGTTATEVALFSRDQLPMGKANDDTLSRLEHSGQALRMKKGPNGHERLYLFIDEDIPQPTRKFCDLAEPTLYRFRTMSGRIGFGGVESTTNAFIPDEMVRQDTEIEPGTYEAVAYKTEYPRNFIERKVRNRIGDEGLKILNYPLKIASVTAAIVVLFLLLTFSFSAGFVVVAILSALTGFLYYKHYTNSPNYKFEYNRKREIELKYPTVVIKMASRRE